MTIQAPSPEQILDIAIDFGLDLSQEDARSFAGLIAGSVPSYNRLDELAEPSLPVKYPRTPGHRPARTTPTTPGTGGARSRAPVRGRSPASGSRSRTMSASRASRTMNGCRVIEGYVPEVDATVVTRILDAGGAIVGKAACEDLCFSVPATRASRCRSRTRTGRRIRRAVPRAAAGCARSRRLQMALGGDQGGSIRMPGSLVRRLRPQGNARARALHRRHADRAHDRPLRAHGEHGRGRRETPERDRRAGRLRSAPDRRGGAGLSWPSSTRALRA